MPRPDKGTRQKLIDTAMDLIWTSSYGSVSVDDICRHAGVKKGSFYHYFPSKKDLVITALEEHFRGHVEPDIVRCFAANLPFEQQVAALADAILEDKRRSLAKYGRVHGCPMASLGSEMAGDEEREIINKVEEMFGHCCTMFENAVQAAMDSGVIPPGDAAAKSEEVYDFMTGVKMMARIHNSLDGMERDLKPGMMRILGLDTATDTVRKA